MGCRFYNPGSERNASRHKTTTRTTNDRGDIYVRYSCLSFLKINVRFTDRKKPYTTGLSGLTNCFTVIYQERRSIDVKNLQPAVESINFKLFITCGFAGKTG